MTNTPEKFWAKVDKSGGPDACWLWLGCKNNDGYGYLYFKGKLFRTHRLAYTLEIGPIPKGLCVLHKCDNPSCCNPKHLYLGTYKDNARDRDLSGRHNPAQGSRQWKSKFTEEQVINIFNDDRSLRVIAADYGVHHSTIWYIKAGRTWKHIPNNRIEKS